MRKTGITIAILDSQLGIYLSACACAPSRLVHRTGMDVSYFEHCARMPPELCDWLAERAADNEGAFSTAEVLESAEVVFAVWPRPGGFAAMAVSGFHYMARGGSAFDSWNAMFVRDEIEARGLLQYEFSRADMLLSAERATANRNLL